MEYLFDKWMQIVRRLNGSHALYFFDYDGTLAPIAQTPQEAVIAPDTKELLGKLSRKHNCTLAIISGREIKDIKSIVGLENIIYAGNHGLEIEGPKIKFESQVSLRLKSVIRNIYEDAVNKYSKMKEVLVEDKGLSVGIHYRMLDSQDMQEFLAIFSEITEPFTVRNKIKISEGKKVYEISPPVAWDKGKTVLWLLARQQFLIGEDKILPVYFGDDITDESAFKVLKKKGLTIFVGESKGSYAAFYVKSAEEVKRFLKQVLDSE